MMMRKHWLLWFEVALLHGLAVWLLWFPYPLHFPTADDLDGAWQNTVQYIDEHWVRPQYYAEQRREAQTAAQRHIAELPPALISRAKPLNHVVQIRCPSDAVRTRLAGKVFLVADITAQGTVGKVAVVEPALNAEVNRLIVAHFSRAKFQPAMSEVHQPAVDQIHFAWAYDCRR